MDMEKGAIENTEINSQTSSSITGGIQPYNVENLISALDYQSIIY